MIKEYQNVDACKLQDELIAVGIVPICTLTLEDGTVEITFSDDIDIDKVDEVVEVVENHDSSPSVIEDSIDDNAIAMAEAIIDMSTQIDDLKNQINILVNGGK
jgi:hypothetical protein